ncbi:M23 family metallopeptidase [Shivajiella indica]|uniref:M23 family metallopeptidase n=1 Tax=Shivajiella indica TaxID=872115 RepID=A0ABW5B9M6_9BACT
MKSSKHLLFLLLFFSSFIQVNLRDEIPAPTYLFPVRPGEKNFLSGNFSEIRPNHFHSGIDVKIGGVNGEPILAIEEGYISRIKVSSFGYGNVIYLKHPNGQSSVYAHLDAFSPKIMDKMRREMYENRKNELELFPDPDWFPVKRGEIIGYGGNTGSSGGPHLHFEIRDSLDRAIDPFSFGFREVVDNTPPVLYRVAVRPLDYESRVNGKFQRQEFTPVMEGNRYLLRDQVKISGNVGLEIYAIDRMEGVNNVFGIPIYELMEGEKTLFRINIDHIDFNIGRYFLTHTHQNRFTRLYPYNNNPLQIYEPNTGSAGIISANPGERRQFRVNMRDYFGNVRSLDFRVEGEEIIHFPKTNTSSSVPGKGITYDREVMVIQSEVSYWGNVAKVFVNGYEMDLPPAYVANGKRTYLWDLNFGIPDSVDLCNEMIKPNVLKKIPFGEEISFANADVEINFSENSLLDDLFLKVEKKNNTSITVNNSQEFLQGNIEVLWKSPEIFGDKSKVHVYFQADNGRKSFIGGEWESGHIRFQTRNFGTFVLDEDIIPPTIQAARVNRENLRFIIRDQKSGIKDFEAFVDGKWVLMRYEHKQNVIWSEKLDKQPFLGEVLLLVRDMAGNESRFSTVIK